jgi:hypothetical protein
MNGGVGLGGFMMNTKLEGVVVLVDCQIYLCDGILVFSGGSEE